MVGKVLKWGSCHFTFWQIWLGEKMQKMIAHHAFSKLCFFFFFFFFFFFYLEKKKKKKRRRRRRKKRKEYFHSFTRNYNENSKHKTNKD
jgi:hypothetical protein